MKIPNILQTISNDFAKENLKTVIVGGSVRDYLMKIEPKDFDIEVYGIDSIYDLSNKLARYGSVDMVGKSFGVVKLTNNGTTYDFSLPRIESKSGAGHRGFDIQTDGKMNFDQAAKRRDFTINSIGYEIETQKIIDPYNGQDDIRKKILRHIDDKGFVEDPLRVYRGIQFAARFDYRLDDTTKSLCKNMVDSGMLDELPKERVYEEWKKLLLKSNKPSIGFELMRELGIIKRYYPELHALISTPQDPRWHPEGNVWVHTMMSIDQMAKICRDERNCIDDEKQKLILMFAALCHDFGKPATTTIESDEKNPHNTHIRAIGHEKAGIEPTVALLQKLSNEQNLIDSILPLVIHHLKPPQFYKQGAKSAAIRRLSTKVNIKSLVLVAKADSFGRDEQSQAKDYPPGDWLLKKAKELNVHNSPPKPLLSGKDLLEIGIKPGIELGNILKEIYQMQLDGKIRSKEDAIWIVKESQKEKKM